LLATEAGAGGPTSDGLSALSCRGGGSRSWYEGRGEPPLLGEGDRLGDRRGGERLGDRLGDRLGEWRRLGEGVYRRGRLGEGERRPPPRLGEGEREKERDRERECLLRR